MTGETAAQARALARAAAFLLQGMEPASSLLPGDSHRGATRAAPLCNQGAPKTPPTTPVLMGAPAGQERRGTCSPEPLCSALRRPSRERPRAVAALGAPDRRGGVSAEETQRCPDT